MGIVPSDQSQTVFYFNKWNIRKSSSSFCLSTPIPVNLVFSSAPTPVCMSVFDVGNLCYAHIHMKHIHSPIGAAKDQPLPTPWSRRSTYWVLLSARIIIQGQCRSLGGPSPCSQVANHSSEEVGQGISLCSRWVVRKSQLDSCANPKEGPLCQAVPGKWTDWAWGMGLSGTCDWGLNHSIKSL